MDKIDLTQEQLQAISELEEYNRNYYRHDGKKTLVRDFRHEIIDLIMIETACKKPNETRVSALREAMTIIERIVDEETFAN